MFLITSYSITSFIAAIIALIVALIAYPRRAQAGGKPILAFMIAVMFWASFEALDYAATSLNTKILMAKLEYIGELSTPVFYLLLVLEYNHMQAWLNRRNFVLLFILPVISYCLIFTNEWHKLVWTSFTPVPGTENLVIFGHGAWFWVGMVGYSYIIMLIGTILLIRSAILHHNIYQGQIFVLIIAAALPWAGNLIYILEYSPKPGYEFTTFLVAITGLLITFDIYQFKLLGLIPVALQSVINSIKEAIIVLDVNNQLIFINPMAQKLLGTEKSGDIGLPAAQAFRGFPEILALLNNPVNHTTQFSQQQVDGMDYYAVEVSTLFNPPGVLAGHSILIQDVTLAIKSQEASRRAAILDERERMVQELHDNLGQALTYLALNANSIRDQIEQGNYAAALGQTESLSLAAQNASMDVRQYILDMKVQSEDFQTFSSVLQLYLVRFESITGLHVRLSLPAESIDGLLSQAEFLVVLRIIQESLANARKHAYASLVQLIFSLEQGNLHLLIIDDGIGFDLSSISAGFGLEGMRKRAAGIDAEFEIRSTLEQGTQILITINCTQLDEFTAGLAGLRVLVVDDHPLFVSGLGNILAGQGLVVAGSAQNAEQAIALAGELQPDLVLLDVHMPGTSGSQAVRSIKAAAPATQVVMLSLDSSSEAVIEAMNNGASGYLLKNQNTKELFQSLAAIRSGEVKLAPGLATQMVKELVLQEVTSHEQAILTLISAGMSMQQINILEQIAQGRVYKEVAADLKISESAVKYHSERIQNILNVQNRSEAIAYAYKLGLATDRRS